MTIPRLVISLLLLPCLLVVEITKTGPLEKLVWAPIKDPDNESKTIHNRTEEATEQGSGSTRPTASFRQNLDFLYNLNHIIITSRLTNHMAQFG